ncbi:hypothetical protein EJB05_36474, partial [Eragrostis curvula]
MESVVDDVCGGRRTLASELARVQAMVRMLEENMDRDLPAAAREVCGELASSVDRSLQIAMSWLHGPESPASGDGSPRGDGGHDTAGTGNAHFKRRKGIPSARKQVRVASVHDTAALEDGLSWRKYGQKEILAAKYPRAYFRCTHRNAQGCLATKQVQRVDGDPLLFNVVYHGEHTCVQGRAPQPQPGHAGQDQTSPPPPALETGFEPTTPFPFASTPAGGDYPLLSPTSMDWQLRSIDATGADMEFAAQYEEFFSNPPESYQWEFQDL